MQGILDLMKRKISILKTVNTSQLLYKGPCLICGIGITGDGANGEIDIYDGVNDSAEHKMKLKCLDSTTHSINTTYPIQFNYGIYVKVNATTTHSYIYWIPQERESRHPRKEEDRE